MTTELNVTGMTCGHCVKAVEKALTAVPGVEAAQVDLSQGRVTVQGAADPQTLIAAVQAEGYSAQVAGA